MKKTMSEEKTPYEKIEKHLEGLTNEQAEDIAVQILAQVCAKHFVLEQDGEQYLNELTVKLVSKTQEYIEDHALQFAICKAITNH